MSDPEKKQDALPPADRAGGVLSDLEELQREVEKRLRDNRRFLERFMEDDFPEDEEEPDGGEEEDFEEL
jgi:hypothetical protein